MNFDQYGDRVRLPEALSSIARAAGAEIMRHYRQGVRVEQKADHSPVTAADRDAEAIIVSALRLLTPGVPVVAEEAVSAGHAAGPCGDLFWLVDPLDGTKEFIGRNGEFTVNIALNQGGRPVAGVVYAPALDRLYAGADDTEPFCEDVRGRRPIHCRTGDGRGLVVVGSRSHGDEAAMEKFLAGCEVESRRPAGSSLKFCAVAEGDADLYPRLGRTMEWDTAAGHAVLRAAGGEVWSLEDGLALAYGKPGFANPHFVAARRPPPSAIATRLDVVTRLRRGDDSASSASTVQTQ
jgi:3'(2'), 5'-bisphosphate nucleotidase